MNAVRKVLFSLNALQNEPNAFDYGLHKVAITVMSLQLMLLLSTRNLPKLLLWNTFQEPLQSTKYFLNTLLVQDVAIRFLDQCFDFD